MRPKTCFPDTAYHTDDSFSEGYPIKKRIGAKNGPSSGPLLNTPKTAGQHGATAVL